MLTETYFTSNGNALFFLFLCIVLLLFGDYYYKLQYFLNGRFLSQHTLNNLLQNVLFKSNQSAMQQCIVQVGQVVNYGFEQQHELAIPIGKELACCSDLVNAHNQIYQTTIEFKIEASSDDLNCLIAPFSLAVLIENALKYGFNQPNQQQINLHITSNSYSINVYLSGYELPSIASIQKPQVAHGLYFLKERLRYFNHYFGCDYLRAIQKKENQLVLSIAKTSA